jgi:hypothetical protein
MAKHTALLPGGIYSYPEHPNYFPIFFRIQVEPACRSFECRLIPSWLTSRTRIPARAIQYAILSRFPRVQSEADWDHFKVISILAWHFWFLIAGQKQNRLGPSLQANDHGPMQNWYVGTDDRLENVAFLIHRENYFSARMTVHRPEEKNITPLLDSISHIALPPIWLTRLWPQPIDISTVFFTCPAEDRVDWISTLQVP